MMVARLGILAVGLFLVSGVATLAAAEVNLGRAEAIGDRIPNQYIVVLKDSVTNADSVESELIDRVSGERLGSYRSAFTGFSARFSENELHSIKNDPRVAFVSEDRTVSTTDARDDIRAGLFSVRNEREGNLNVFAKYSAYAQTQTLPTGINRVHAVDLNNKGSGVNVAVIDTGILTKHPDLVANVVGGKDCSRSGGGYVDQNGHGTHVAGIVAAMHNTKGVVGVAPGAKLWSVKVLNRYGSGSWSSVICGLDFVTSKAPAKGGPITVANLSLGGMGASDNNCGNTNNDALHKAICRARDAGVTIVVAAGNSGENTNNYVPASYDDAVITVSALADSDGKFGGLGTALQYGADDTFATFSNYGSAVDIGAPGVNIYSTWIGNAYKTISGTSMASPHVAGAAALYIATHPTAQWTEVKNALVSAGELLGNGHTDPSLNHPEPVLLADSL